MNEAIYPKASAPTSDETTAEANARAERWRVRCMNARAERDQLDERVDSLRDELAYAIRTRDEWEANAEAAEAAVARVEALVDEWQRYTLPGMTDWDRADDIRRALDRDGERHYCDKHITVWASDYENEDGSQDLPNPPYLLIHDGDTDNGADDGLVTLVTAAAPTHAATADTDERGRA